MIRSVHAPRSLRASLPEADAYTVPASSLITRLVGRRVQVLPPLVDGMFRPEADREALRRELGLTGSPLIGMVSTFQVTRRHALGVEAFAENGHVVLKFEDTGVGMDRDMQDRMFEPFVSGSGGTGFSAVCSIVVRVMNTGRMK